jgi:hypothetical protein
LVSDPCSVLGDRVFIMMQSMVTSRARYLYRHFRRPVKSGPEMVQHVLHAQHSVSRRKRKQTPGGHRIRVLQHAALSPSCQLIVKSERYLTGEKSAAQLAGRRTVASVVTPVG